LHPELSILKVLIFYFPSTQQNCIKKIKYSTFRAPFKSTYICSSYVREGVLNTQ
jgi:hypothetical protein